MEKQRGQSADKPITVKFEAIISGFEVFTVDIHDCKLCV